MEKGKISVWQAILLLSLSRIFSVLNYIPAFNVSVEGTAMLYGILIAFIFHAIIIIPMLILYNRVSAISPLSLAYSINKIFGIVISILFLLNIVLAIIGSASAFNFFLLNVIFPEAPLLSFALIMLIPCAIAGCYSFEGIARAGTVVFVFVAISAVFIGLVSIPDASLLNVRPIIENPAKSVLDYAFQIFTRDAELYMGLLILYRVNGSKVKTMYWFLGISCVFNLAANFLIQAVLGDYAYTQLFPFFTTTAVLEVPIFQRLDAFHMLNWVALSFMRITLLFFLGKTVLKNLLPGKAKKYSILLLLAIVTPLTILFSRNMAYFKGSSTRGISLSLPLIVLFPLILLCFVKKEKKNETDKTNVIVADNSCNID